MKPAFLPGLEVRQSLINATGPVPGYTFRIITRLGRLQLTRSCCIYLRGMSQPRKELQMRLLDGLVMSRCEMGNTVTPTM